MDASSLADSTLCRFDPDQIGLIKIGLIKSA